ncbi:hypothetical protein [Mesorhizobium sp.]|uniref:hypothetical protein n=1 Tax=Mesorhizobium sp. TaxID=1871066 RepID=UPI0025C6B163|nr:hypothetical protein [Mesorhizobium sp.]
MRGQRRRAWHVRRTSVPTPTGQQRWDRAYQLLLQWAIYGRVSTSHQVDHETIEQQLGRLSAHVHAHAAEGWSLDPAHVFRDGG